MPRPKPNEELVQIAARVPPRLLARLDAEAAEAGLSRNTALAAAVEAYVSAAEGRRAGKKLAAGLKAQAERVEAAKAPIPQTKPGRMTMDDVRPKPDYGSRLKQPKGQKR